VIFEYKRATNQNVINQGLFYLDWLMDHRADFHLLVMKRLGATAAEIIDWSNPRLICVAADFTRYDEHAVLQIHRSIELVRYRDYGGEHLVLELITSTTAKATAAGAAGPDSGAGNGVGGSATPSGKSGSKQSVIELHAQAPDHVKALFEALEAYLLGLGEDVSKKTTSFYYAYRRLKNFACVEVHPQTKTILVYVKVSPDKVELEPGFTRDVRKIGHFGTGDLEIALTTPETLERAKPLLDASYETS
jgi:predicted transport protein